MTDTQLFMEYEFDPTLTTSELRVAQAKREAEARKPLMLEIGREALSRYEVIGISPIDLAEAFDGNLEAILAFCKENLYKTDAFVADKPVYVATDYDAERRWEERARKHLAELEREIVKSFEAFLANPDADAARKAIELIDHHSDYFKDINHFRPHGKWQSMFGKFTPRHRAVWQSVWDDMTKPRRA